MKTRCQMCGKEGETPLPFPDYSIRSYCGLCVHLSDTPMVSAEGVKKLVDLQDEILEEEIIGD